MDGKMPGEDAPLLIRIDSSQDDTPRMPMMAWLSTDGGRRCPYLWAVRKRRTAWVYRVLWEWISSVGIRAFAWIRM